MLRWMLLPPAGAPIGMRARGQPIWPFFAPPLIWTVLPGTRGSRLEVGVAGITIGGARSFGWPIGLGLRPEIITFGAPISAAPGLHGQPIGGGQAAHGHDRPAADI